MSKTNALIIDERDTVAVVTFPVEPGDKISYQDKKGEIQELTAETKVPIYHKVAIKEMEKGSQVVKYGEHIGLAGCDIHVGEHVHVHNVENHREEL